MPSKALARSFFLDTPDIVAPALLGKLLVRRLGGELLVARIVETEAYFGADDAAAHAAAGRTARTEVIFGPAGHAYVYFIYGMHSCLNIICEPEGKAGCVLLRAVEPLAGLPTMARLRGGIAQPRLLTAGPGRLCRALGITRANSNGLDVTREAVTAAERALLQTLDTPLADLHLEMPGATPDALHVCDDGFVPAEIAISPRIGIRKSADLPARFFIRGNNFVSGPRKS